MNRRPDGPMPGIYQISEVRAAIHGAVELAAMLHRDSIQADLVNSYDSPEEMEQPMPASTRDALECALWSCLKCANDTIEWLEGRNTSPGRTP